MARIRTIKPEFFTHYQLYEAEIESGLPLRVAFAGLWTQADREGRFKWIPQQLKLGCLPYDDVDFSRVLDALMTRGFVVKYSFDGRDYGVIPGFSTHQVINNRESDSVLPEPTNCAALTRADSVTHASVTREVHAQAEGKGRERKGKEGVGERFSPPLVADVAVYCKERGNGVDPQKFHDFYESKGWMVGKNKMKDWKAAVRTWETRGEAEQKQSQQQTQYRDLN